MKAVLITGAAGNIGSAVAQLLRREYRLRLLDARALPDSEDDRVQADVSDLAAMEQACGGMDAVLHLAGQPSTRATWDEVRVANIEGTHAVFEAARRAGVSKVVFASTNHVVGFENLESRWPIGEQPPRADSLYGVSKAFGEVLARYYADSFDMSMICLRIGWFTPHDPTQPRHKPLWISTRDLAQIFALALETPRRFGIYNATSANSMRQWDITRAREELGYQPLDDVTALQLPAHNGVEASYVDPQAGVLRALS